MITIGKLVRRRTAGWEELFRAYNTFYESEYPQSMYDRAWAEFQADERMHAPRRVAGRHAGWHHPLLHPRADHRDRLCYLEDLFTAPAARGQGVGRALINAVGRVGGERDCGRVYWHTHETNATARLLYDKVASCPDSSCTPWNSISRGLITIF